MSEPSGAAIAAAPTEDLRADVPAELMRSLGALAEPPDPALAPVAEALGLGPLPGTSDHADLFMFQLYPYASVHVGAEGMIGGEAADRVAGFWRAVGRVPPAEPDHLAALLGLYASLAEEEWRVEGAERPLIARARTALLHEHVAPWVFLFLDRVGEIATGFYAGWASLLESVLREEVQRVPEAESLPAHLREMPPVPDPRMEGAAAFLKALFAPARSGVLITRTDIAQVARDLDLGLRAGERRYALEHLLGQQPPGTLTALAGEARRQADLHRARAEWLPLVAALGEGRARGTARLLAELAEGSESADVEVGEASPHGP